MDDRAGDADLPRATLEDQAIKASQAKNFDDLNGVVAGTPFDKHLRFFNFGYRVLGDENPAGPRLGPTFPNQDSAQLLFQVVGDTPIAGRRVADVGCGRGGNLWLLRRHYQPRLVVGLDIAERSIEFCRRSMPDCDAQFAVADAEALPLADACMDVVTNVETSCTYPDIERFFREVGRVLVVGGDFLYADLIHADLYDAFVSLLDAVGLELSYRRDITPNVAASRRARAERQKLAYGPRPEGDAATMQEFVGASGSQLSQLLADGDQPYTLMRFTKARQVDPPPDPCLSEHQRDLVRRQAAAGVDLLSIPSASG